jgi:hypothetical protein
LEAGRSDLSDPSNGMVISAFNDAQDWWMSYGIWGNAGVERLMERYQQADIQRVYWRATQGSLCWWPSKVGTPYHGVHLGHSPDVVGRTQAWYSEKDAGLEISSFDQLASAAKKASGYGVELWLYYPPFLDDDTGNGWMGGWEKDHPEWFRVFRNKVTSNTNMSFAYPEVVEHKLGLVKELLQYDIKGVMLDCVRQHCFLLPDGGVIDENLVYLGGYEEPIVRAFREKTGKDPFAIPNSDDEWIQFRADYNTEFVRRVRKLIRGTKPEVKLGAMVRAKGHKSGKRTHQGNALRETLIDLSTWSKEGLIDSLLQDSYAPPPTGEQLVEQLNISRSQVDPHKIAVGVEMALFGKWDVASLAAAMEGPAAAGAKEFAFYQDTCFEDANFRGRTNVWKELSGIVKPYRA